MNPARWARKTETVQSRLREGAADGVDPIDLSDVILPGAFQPARSFGA